VSVRSILILVLALVFGGSAALFVKVYLAQNRGGPPVDTVPVVEANDSIPLFTALSAEHLVVRNYPKEFAPAGCVQNVDEAVDRVTLASLRKGEPVIADKLSAKGVGAGIGAMIPDGMRAFTIDTPSVTSHAARFILPGSKVDVLLTEKTNGAEDGTGGPPAKTLLQNIKVLAVDRHLEVPAAAKADVKELRSVTLLLTPAQANKLAAKLDNVQAGTLHLTLRKPGDENAEPEPVSPADPKLAKVAAAPEKREEAKAPESAPPDRPVSSRRESFLPDVLPALPIAPATPAPPVIRTLRGTMQGAVELQ
jgi:pilus assembly protein CpaB